MSIPTGYSAAGVVGYNTDNNNCFLRRVQILTDSNNDVYDRIYGVVRNVNSASATSTLTFDILFVKDSSFYRNT